jgi:hypothetical protein
MTHKDDHNVKFGVCQFHAGTLIKYMSPDQQREFLFPEPRQMEVAP